MVSLVTNVELIKLVLSSWWKQIGRQVDQPGSQADQDELTKAGFC